jgi:hypothetical protein
VIGRASGWLLGTAVWALSTGCAGPQPVRPTLMNCQTLRMSVANGTERMEFPSWGFSVQPPSGDHWCRGRSSPNGAMFVSNPFLGQVVDKRPSDAEVRHSLVLMVAADDVPNDKRIETEAEMIAFLERQFLGKRPGSRFTVVESKFTQDASLGAECVRFDAVIEERDNPDARNLVLIGVMRDSFLCRHPNARTPTLVLISVRERYVQGTLAGTPLLIDTLRAEWHASVRSVQFTPRP